MRNLFQIDPKSNVPIFQQIIDQVECAVLAGLLGPGDYLPSVRELATECTVNPNTVAKAYQALQMSGWVEPIRGRGLVVCALKAHLLEKRKTVLLESKVLDLLRMARSLNVSIEDLIGRIRKVGGSE